MDQTHVTSPPFTDLIDLASSRLGGRAIAASDDFFAEKDNLLKPEPAVFIPGKFTDRGKWMDGWESRRKRQPGHDWCVIALGRPGTVAGVNVDTSHFNGNQPEFCTLEGAECPKDIGDDELTTGSRRVVWHELVRHAPLGPSRQHLLPIVAAATDIRFTHVRLNIFPDGGVARLRVYGRVRPDPADLAASDNPIDLAAAVNGGLVVAANDMHFGSRHNLIMPGRPLNMGDGWETRRKRGLTWGPEGPNEHDWCIVQLGHRGTIRRIEVDTTHFKGNFPHSCRVEACDADASILDPDRANWTELLPRTRLRADHRHEYDWQLSASGTGVPWTHVRLSIYPDGGVSRLRVWGMPAPEIGQYA